MRLQCRALGVVWLASRQTQQAFARLDAPLSARKQYPSLLLGTSAARVIGLLGRGNHNIASTRIRMHQATDGPDSRSGTEATRGCPYLVRVNHLAAELNPCIGAAGSTPELATRYHCLLPTHEQSSSRHHRAFAASPCLCCSSSRCQEHSSAELGFSGAAAHTASAAVSGAAAVVTALADLASAPADPEAGAGQRM